MTAHDPILAVRPVTMREAATAMKAHFGRGSYEAQVVDALMLIWDHPDYEQAYPAARDLAKAAEDILDDNGIIGEAASW